MIQAVADCLDARYEEDIETLLLFCYLRDMGVKRVIQLHKSDFTFHGEPVPDVEMHRTAQMWKGKPFYFNMDDDPTRDLEATETDEEYFAHEKVYMGKVGAEMMKIADEMNSDQYIMKLKQQKIMDKDAAIRKKMEGFSCL